MYHEGRIGSRFFANDDNTGVMLDQGEDQLQAFHNEPDVDDCSTIVWMGNTEVRMGMDRAKYQLTVT